MIKTNRAERRMARMVLRDRLGAEHAGAAMKLVSIVLAASEEGDGPAGGVCGLSHRHCGKPAGRQGAVNRQEQQAHWRLDNRQLLGRWHTAMEKAGGDLDAIIHVLVLGESFSAVDRHRRRRKGWARQQVRLGIQVFYGVLRGKQQQTKLDKSGQKEYQIG